MPDAGRREPVDGADVVVVGGGPAGLAAAIAARLQGFSVAVVDRARPPIDKACGEGLMPDGLKALNELGVALAPEQLRAFGGIRYLDGVSVAEGRFPPAHQGAGIRRLHLHQALVRRAQEVGVRLCWGLRVTGVEQAGVATEAGSIAARWVVGADGLHSRVRRWAGLDTPAPRWQRFGVRRHYRIAPWSDCVEVYWAAGCEAYVTAVGEREVGVAVLWSGRKAGFDELLESFPELRQRVHGFEATSRDRGCGPLRQRTRAVARGRIALVGDASGYVDAITGEGLSLAFHQAQALASALAADDLRLYAARHRRLGLLPGVLTDLLLWVERRPRMRRRLIQTLADEPALFSRLLALHARALPAHRGLFIAQSLLWRLATLRRPNSPSRRRSRRFRSART